MRISWLLGIFLAFFVAVAEATQYRALPLAKQVEEADVFVSGAVSEVSVFERDGRVWSKVTITINKALNYESPQIVFQIPGGSLNGRSMKIETVDLPSVGDEKNYLLKKVKDEFYLSNLGLGEYKKSELNGKEFYTSKIFSDLPGLKNLTLEDFQKASGSKKWKTFSFEVPTKISHPNYLVPDKERTLPMVDDVKTIQKRQKEAGVFRIILWVLGLSLLVFILYNMQKKNNGGK